MPPQETTSALPQLLHHQVTLLPNARLILDVGMHHGHSTKEYLDIYPDAIVYGFEPESENFEKGAELVKPYGSRAKPFKLAVSDQNGPVPLNITSHDGSHSLLNIGEVGYFESYIEIAKQETVQSITLDLFCSAEGIERIDILKMDIQGAELKALCGARSLLEKKGIRLIATEVEFERLYEHQPLFWEVHNFLDRHGFRFYGLFDQKHIKGALSWADAIFVLRDSD